MNRFSYIVALIAIGLSSRLLTALVRPPQNVEINFLAISAAAIGLGIWISVLRAKNAGKPAWVGALILVPFLGTFLLIYLLFAPPKKIEVTESASGLLKERTTEPMGA